MATWLWWGARKAPVFDAWGEGKGGPRVTGWTRFIAWEAPRAAPAAPAWDSWTLLDSEAAAEGGRRVGTCTRPHAHGHGHKAQVALRRECMSLQAVRDVF